MADPFRILVTGATGLCGREIVHALRTALPSAEVYSTSRRPIDHELHRCHDLKQPIRLGEGGFPDRLDVVVHCAAVVDEASSEFGIVESNLRAVFNLGQYAREAEVRNFIHLSSVAVYGSPLLNRQVDESHPLQPETLYGLSKKWAEEAASFILGEGSKLVNLRLGYVLGQGVPERYVISRLYRRLLASEEIVLQNAEQSRFNFIDARDIAAVVLRLVRDGVSGDFNLVSSEHPSLAEVFEVLRQLVPDSRSRVIELQDSSATMRVRYSNQSILEAIGGYRFYEFNDSITRALDKSEL